MKLTQLDIENFMPFKGKQSIEFPQDSYRNVLLVFGENMRGKTSILNAVRWCLYGKAVGRHSREIPVHHIMNVEALTQGDRSFTVSLEFNHNGSRYVVTRRAEKRPLVSKPTRPEDYDVSVRLLVDGNPIIADRFEQTIAEIVPEEVSRFFLFDGELLQEYEMLLVDSSIQSREIKDAIESILGVPAFINTRDHLRALLVSARKDQQRDLARVANLRSTAERQQELSSKLELLESDLDILRTKQSELRKRSDSLTIEIEDHESAYSQHLELEKLKHDRTHLETTRDDINLRRLDLMAVAWLDLFAKRADSVRLALRQQQDAITRDMKSQGKVNARIENIESLLEKGSCPVCEQVFDGNKRESYVEQVRHLRQELTEERDLQSQLDLTRTHLDQIQSIRFSQVGMKLRELEDELNKVVLQDISIEGRVKDLTKVLAGFDSESIRSKRNEHDQLVREDTRLGTDIETTERDLDRVRTDLKLSQATIPKDGSIQQQSSRKVEVLDKLESIFAESISDLRDRLKSSVQSRASIAFKELSTQSAYRGLVINENYGLQIMDDSDQIVTIRSAGAEQIVALSLIDGLNRTGRGIGPIVMDTPFGRLDVRHRGRVLKYLPTTANQLVLLVHSGEIRGSEDLSTISDRVGIRYEIHEINQYHSEIKKVIA